MNAYQPDANTHELYIQGKLNEQEETAYELWLADHPDVMADLELDLMMKEGIIESENKNHSTLIDRKETTVFPKYLLYIMHSVAYALAMVFLINIFFNQKSLIEPGLLSTKSQVVDMFIERSIYVSDTVQHLNKNVDLVLRFFPDEYNNLNTYIVSLKHSGHSEPIIFEQLKSYDSNTVSLILPAELILPGKWEVVFASHTGNKKQHFNLFIKN